MEEKKTGSWKKKTAVGVVAAAASASVLVGGAFDSPADVLNPDIDDGDSPAPIVETVTLHTAPAANGGDTSDDGETRRHRFPAIRRWIQSLPTAVRALVGVPLWCVGWGITELLSLLWQTAMTPLGSKILSWALAACALILVYALTARALFPNAPWKKIMRPRNLLILLGGMAIFGAADAVLSVFWKEYPPIGRLVRLIGGALMLTCAWLSSRKLLRRAEKKAAPGEDEPSSPRTDVEEQAMALADSVCPPSVPRS